MVAPVSVVTHNVWVGQTRKSARGHLATIAGAHTPDVVFLQEAKRLDGNMLDGFLNIAGATQLGEDHDNCRILLREGAFELVTFGAWKVPGPTWVWNGKDKPTRVFPFVVARRVTDGRVFVLVSVHRIPGGPVPGIAANRIPWAEEHDALILGVESLWRYQYPAATVVLGGDWNARADDKPEHPESLASLARDLGGAHVAVKHIDGFLTLGGQPRDVRKLDDLHGSDGHRPVIGKVAPS